MTIGAYILLQNPKTNNYPYLEVISCCLDLFDEILIVDGGTDDGQSRAAAGNERKDHRNR